MLIQSALGFGAGLIGVPLLVLMLPVAVAAPLVGLMSITSGMIIVAQDWHDVDVRSLRWLLVSSLFGMPLGLLLLDYGNPHLLKGALAIFLLFFSIYCLWGGERLRLQSDRAIWLCVCGFFAGIVGQAYGMSGPPLVIYAALRRWTAGRFRSTGQAFFLPTSFIIMAGYWLIGDLDWTVTSYFLYSLPASIVAVLIGRAMNRRLQKHSFHRYLYASIICVGLVLLFQALHEQPAKMPAKKNPATRETASVVHPRKGI